MDDHPEHKRFVSIEYFMVEMLGFKDRQSYYDHTKDPGWPQRVFPAGKPMLVYDECLAYQLQLIEDRSPPVLPPSPRTLRRRIGRPVKAPA